jgi:hypothetical protein
MNKELLEPATNFCKEIVEQFLEQKKFDEINIKIVRKDDSLSFAAGYAEIAQG